MQVYLRINRVAYIAVPNFPHLTEEMRIYFVEA